MRANEEARTRRVEPSREVVCVLGASGYITSWLINLLLQHEYSINAIVRDPHDLKKTELIKEGSFDLVVESCIGVFHTASLCYFDVKDPQAEMVEPIVKGTLNVLGSYAKVPSIKGVLINFSIAALILIGKPLADDVVVDETWFSDPVVCEKLKVFDFLLSPLIVPLKK
ncbi:hypothetical protein Goshw_012684 [Gossypium schwendimanii]|uniref:NAD-dependent epimerase/dehydratase domain-containing protein n=1 Tax=Gossypium schwendimanii TaxID=34291 RepID=A0A7J9KX87_GOSSC|nr:hypothetical protein [Gossypium schwendimanii]